MYSIYVAIREKLRIERVSMSFYASIWARSHQEIITLLEELSIRLLIFCVGGGRREVVWVYE